MCLATRRTRCCHNEPMAEPKSRFRIIVRVSRNRYMTIARSCYACLRDMIAHSVPVDFPKTSDMPRYTHKDVDAVGIVYRVSKQSVLLLGCIWLSDSGAERNCGTRGVGEMAQGALM